MNIEKLQDIAKVKIESQNFEKITIILEEKLKVWGKITQIDTKNIRPWFSKAYEKSFRKDSISNSLTPEQATSQAGKKDKNMFIVPEVI